MHGPPLTSSFSPNNLTWGAGGIVTRRADDVDMSDPSAHVATSADETLLLTPLGDVIVCRHDDSYYFNPCDDEADNSYEEKEVGGNEMGYGRYSRGYSQQSFDVLDESSQYDDWYLTDDHPTGGLQVPFGQLALKNDGLRDHGRDTQHDNNYHLDSTDRHGMSQWEDCCDMNACYAEPKGLCGGAEESLTQNTSESSRTNRVLASNNSGENYEHIGENQVSRNSWKYPNGKNCGSNVDNVDDGWNHVVSRRNRKSSSPNPETQLQREGSTHNGVDKILSSKNNLNRHAKKSASKSSEPTLTITEIGAKNYQSADTSSKIGFTDSGDNDSLFITSPPQSYLGGVSTSSISEAEDEDYGMFNAEANGVSIGNDSSFDEIGARKGSPTPIMSFDYTGYEPPTPESSTSYEYNGDINSCEGIIMNENNTKNIYPIGTMTKGGHGNLKETNPDTLSRNMKSTSHVYTIRPRLPLKKPFTQGKQSRFGQKFVDPSSVIPGIPTFLNHLSQIRITKLSAHPRGHHVLLISEEGLLFSYGSNDRGQLGLGKHPKSPNPSPNSPIKEDGGKNSWVTIPSIVTPLLEHGGKTIDCAAGIDYSLVVVKTEGARIANNRNHRQPHSPKQPKLGYDGNSKGSGRTSLSSSVNHIQEWTAHHQMYGFGNNDHLKLGLLDPGGSRNKLTTNNSFSTPRLRRRGGALGSGSKSRINSPILCSSPDIASPCSLLSSSSADDSSEAGSELISTDVFLPRRVALHCKIVSRKPQSDIQLSSNVRSNGAPSPPFGIFCIAASIEHSAALVRRPSGSVELYTWGRGDHGALGLSLPPSVLQESGLKGSQTAPLQSSHWIEALCNGKEKMTNSDGHVTTNSPETKKSATQVSSRHMITSPTLAVSLSQLPASHKATHPPLPKSYSGGSGAPPRSPQKGKNGKMRHAQFKKSNSNTKTSLNVSNVGDLKCALLPSEHIVKIALGPSCTHAITSKGRWLVCGTSLDGLLGLGDDIHGVYVPTEVKIPQCKSVNGDSDEGSSEHVTNISVGHRHAVALTNKRSTYSWGFLPHSTAFVSKPEMISCFEADFETKVKLKREEYLSKYISGDASYFRSITKQPTSKATKQDLNISVNSKENSSSADNELVTIAHAGLDLSVFVLRSGSVLTCGKRSGRLGQGENTRYSPNPQPLFGNTRLWQV
ncbi:hypothetical protein ACHAXS_012101 [Conticribra weissflogii]